MPVNILQKTCRRGTTLIATLIVITMVSLAVVSAIKASADDVRIGLTRLDSARALYAAESGLRILIREDGRDAADQLPSVLYLPLGERINFIQLFEDGDADPNQALVAGANGLSERILFISAE